MESIKIPKIVLPVNLMLLLAPLIKWLKTRKGYDSPFDIENLYFLKHGIKKMDSSKAQRELGHQCRPVEETLADLIKWFRENDYLK